MYIKKNAMQRPLLRAFPLLLGEEREGGDEGGSVMNGRIYFEDFKTRGDATRGKSDVTENFTFLTFVYIYIYIFNSRSLSFYISWTGFLSWRRKFFEIFIERVPQFNGKKRKKRSWKFNDSSISRKMFRNSRSRLSRVIIFLEIIKTRSY